MATVLMVCSGNQCRSPAAALLLERLLGPSVEVTSAGISAREGSSIPRPMRRVLREDGLDGRAHRARRLTREVAEQADLIIPMARAHGHYIALLSPTAGARTVPLGQLAAIARQAPPPAGASVEERIAEVVDVAARGSRASSASAALDVPDTFGGSVSQYRETYSLIRGMVAAVAGWLAPAPPRSPQATISDSH
ncbi:arsenate reductase/protein-tyrosine-phosphatase family protein [Demequina gelatinilytica]|uniref:arsenate reductase/protein-tyrosine-phosphatase family protein n=1 Tax=Demequina gelatinilytica TaxID=1638980 RepID=UPI000783C798|nr:low molecular weight phosphatase family protein [Demequina gelatinilytica]